MFVYRKNLVFPNYTVDGIRIKKSMVGITSMLMSVMHN